MRKYWRQVFIGIAFTVMVMIGVVLLSNARDLADRLDAFPLWLFLPIIGLKFINWILRYLEWHYFLHIVDVRPVIAGKTAPAPSPDEAATIRVDDSFILWMASLPFSLSPGKMAEVLKALILKSMTGTPVMRSTPIIFAERLIDGLAVVIIVSGAALLSPDAIFSTNDISTSSIRLIMLGTTVFMIGLIAVAQFKWMAYWLLDIAAQLPFVSRFEAELRSFYDSSYELTKLKHLGRTVILGIGAYFTDCIGFYLILRGLGEPPSTILFVQATFILGFSVIISAISAMPGGAGGREVTIGVMLSGLVGMDDAATGAAVLIIGIFQVWFGAFLGIIIGLLFRKRLFPPGLQAEISAYENRHDTTAAPVSP